MKLLFFLFLSLFGCSHQVGMMGNPSSPYHDLLSSLSQTHEFYGLEKVRYLTTMTYKTQALEEAYVEEYARNYKVTPEEKEALLKKEREANQGYYVFLVSHFATDKDAAKISKLEDVWRLTLQPDASQDVKILPESVSSLPLNTVNRYFYPHALPWSKVYVVKFKKEIPSTKMILHMDGVLANLKFSWTEKE